jgi:hypothetical protein
MIGMWRFVRECAGGVVRWEQAYGEAQMKMMNQQLAYGEQLAIMQGNSEYLERILGDCALKIARTHSAGGGRHATLQAEHSKFQAGHQAASLTLRGFTVKGATNPTSQRPVGEVGVSGREGGWYPPTRSVSSPPLHQQRRQQQQQHPAWCDCITCNRCTCRGCRDMVLGTEVHGGVSGTPVVLTSIYDDPYWASVGMPRLSAGRQFPSIQQGSPAPRGAIGHSTSHRR